MAATPMTTTTISLWGFGVKYAPCRIAWRLLFATNALTDERRYAPHNVGQSADEAAVRRACAAARRVGICATQAPRRVDVADGRFRRARCYDGRCHKARDATERPITA